MVHRQVVDAGPQVAPVQRASARPARTAARPAGRPARPRRAPTGRVDPVQRRARSRKRPPALLGPPTSTRSGTVCGMVQRPSTSAHVPDHAPGDERGAAQHLHVADLAGPRHELLGQRIDGAAADQRARRGEVVEHLPGRVVPRRISGSSATLAPAPAASSSSHPRRPNNGTPVIAVIVSMAPRPRQRVVGHRLGRPVARRLRVGLGQPGEEREQLSLVAGLARRRGRRARPADRRRGGQGSAPARSHRPRPSTGPWPTRPPRRPGRRRPPDPARTRTSSRQAWSDVVHERTRLGHRHRVRHAGPGPHGAVLVDGHGLHRGGADVDPDGDLGALPGI